jgi:hypothetical protein
MAAITGVMMMMSHACSSSQVPDPGAAPLKHFKSGDTSRLIAQRLYETRGTADVFKSFPARVIDGGQRFTHIVRRPQYFTVRTPEHPRISMA